jgi:hypothetical protein
MRAKTKRFTYAKLVSKIKRHIHVYCFPNLTERKIRLREGQCLQCGRCCELVFKCPMLHTESVPLKCRIYPYRSKLCKQFPIHEEDLKDVDFLCGYKFKKEQVKRPYFKSASSK